MNKDKTQFSILQSIKFQVSLEPLANLQTFVVEFNQSILSNPASLEIFLKNHQYRVISLVSETSSGVTSSILNGLQSPLTLEWTPVLHRFPWDSKFRSNRIWRLAWLDLGWIPNREYEHRESDCFDTVYSMFYEG